MHWCDEINNMLILVPPVIFKQIYREHDMLLDGLFKQIGYGTYFETLDGMVKNMANLLAAELFQHLIFQYLMLCFIIYVETFSAS